MSAASSPVDVTQFGSDEEDAGFVCDSVWSPELCLLSSEVKTFFHQNNARHLAVARGQKHTAGTPPPRLARRRRFRNPVVTRAGSWRDNFTVHESRGLGTCPSPYYTDPNSVHHLNQKMYFPLQAVLCIKLKQRLAPASKKLHRD